MKIKEQFIDYDSYFLVRDKKVLKQDFSSVFYKKIPFSYQNFRFLSITFALSISIPLSFIYLYITDKNNFWSLVKQTVTDLNIFIVNDTGYIGFIIVYGFILLYFFCVFMFVYLLKYLFTYEIYIIYYGKAPYLLLKGNKKTIKEYTHKLQEYLNMNKKSK